MVAFFVTIVSLTFLSCSIIDEFPEESDGEGGKGAQTETAEVRAEPPGQPDQRAGPLQKSRGVSHCQIAVLSKSHFKGKTESSVVGIVSTDCVGKNAFG